MSCASRALRPSPASRCGCWCRRSGPRVTHQYDRPWTRVRARARPTGRHRPQRARSRGVDARAARMTRCTFLPPHRRRLDEIVEPVDLGQPPGDVVVLSFADSDLAGLAAAWASGEDHAAERAARSSARSAPSDVGRSVDRSRRHPCQGDPGAARSAGSTGGATASSACRCSRASAGSCSRCCPARTATTRASRRLRRCRRDELDALLRFFREGGRENMRALLRRLARHAGARARAADEPQPVPRIAGYLPGDRRRRSRAA